MIYSIYSASVLKQFQRREFSNQYVSKIIHYLAYCLVAGAIMPFSNHLCFKIT